MRDVCPSSLKSVSRRSQSDSVGKKNQGVRSCRQGCTIGEDKSVGSAMALRSSGNKDIDRLGQGQAVGGSGLLP